MGYYSNADGTLVCTPACSILPDWATDGDGDLVAEVSGEPETVGVLPDGSIGIIPGSQEAVFRIRWDDQFKAYYTDSQIRTLVQHAAQEGCTVNGSITIVGEEQGDVSRIRVDNNQVIVEQAQLVWPDGTKVSI